MRTATEKEIEFINKYRAKNPMAADAVYVEPFLLINSQFIPKYSMFLHPKAVKQTAMQAGAKDFNGLNFKVMHSREKVVSLGKSFAGAFDEKSSSSYVKFYFPKGFSENGYSVDELVKGIDAGIYAETSMGFGSWPLKEKSIKCSLCGGNPLWIRAYMGGEGQWCGHFPGNEYPVTEAMQLFIDKAKSEGMDSYPGMATSKVGDMIEARMWMMDTEDTLSELSLVDRGASDSRPAREDEIPVKFSELSKHPAFQLTLSDKGYTPADVQALIKKTSIEISIPFMKTSESDIDSDDIDLPGGERGKKSTTNGGEKKVKLKDELKKFFGSIQAELDDSTEAVTHQTVVVASAHDTEALKVMNSALMAAGYDGKDLPAFLAGMKSFEADAKKYNDIPAAMRGQIESAALSWEQVASYIQAVQLELDTACTDYIAAAVAAKGDEVKAEVLKEEITLKAKAFGVAPALEYCRKMIATLAAGEPVKPGQSTTGQAPTVGEEPDQAAKETALRAMAREAAAQMNKN